jgi:hypothetical protein
MHAGCVVLWVTSGFAADPPLAAQGELQLGVVRSADIDGVGTDAITRTSATGLGLGLGARWSLVGALTEPESFYVRDWWGGEVGIGSYIGRGSGLWYEFDFDFGVRVGLFEDDFQVYVMPMVRTGNFRGKSGTGMSGHPNYNLALQLGGHVGPAVVELEVPKPPNKSRNRGWAHQTSLTLGFRTEKGAVGAIRWELTAIGSGEDDHRARQGIVSFVFRAGG